VRHREGSLKEKVYCHKCIYLKHKRSQINDLLLHLKLLEKQEQANLKTSRRREVVKIRAETKKIWAKQTNKESNKIK
jgi:hypothetical protein